MAQADIGKIIGGVVSAGVLVWMFSGGVEKKVANDAIDQYNVARRVGDKTQVCVHAGLVAAAFLQAKDEAKYREWHAIEERDCEASSKEFQRKFERDLKRDMERFDR